MLILSPTSNPYILKFIVRSVLLAQIMTRLDLDWLGDVNQHANGETNRRTTFQRIICLVATYFASKIILVSITFFGVFTRTAEKPSSSTDDALLSGAICYHISVVLDYIFGLYTIFLIIKARSIIRIKSGISSPCPPCPNSVIDCCWAFWCGCCTVAQMARHTADYRHNNAACCTESGLKKTEYDVIVQHDEDFQSNDAFVG